MIPIENKFSGFREESIINLMKYDFPIVGMHPLHITHTLVGFGKIERAKLLYAPAAAHEQCRERIEAELPNLRLIETGDSLQTAIQLKLAKDPEALAIVSPIAAKKFALPVLKERMEDTQENTTTFYAIGKKPTKHTKNDQSTFLIFSDILGAAQNQIERAIKEKKVPLVRIKNLILQEGQTPLYFVELKGHIEERAVVELFETLKKKFLIKHLGSYAV